ncbi:MAG: DUF2092 domain-containing protein [Sedimentisphaerales bacterium]|nr:DUF2092 domain-containing protein [Sedimentisphaerales bacterium]
MISLASALVIMATLLAGQAKADNDGAAIELLRQAGQVLQENDSFTVEITAEIDFTKDDLRHIESSNYVFTAVRPNRFALRVVGDWSPVTVIRDGQQDYAYQGLFHQYHTRPAAGDFRQLFDADNPISATLGVLPMAEELLTGDFLSTILEQNMTISDLGQQEFDGQTLAGVRLVADMIDLDLWFTTGSTILLHHVQADYERFIRELRSHQANMPETSMTQRWTFNNWQLGEPVADDVFTIDPPVGAEQVFQFGPQPPRHPLLGQPAPSFTLHLLDGSTRSLSDYLGRDIVILDFWAVRCPPCRDGLPVITAVADEYRDQGVVFYAVNLEDSARGIENVFDSLDSLTSPPMVARDTTGRAGNLYQVGPIPQTVIIGRDGLVQSVHLGFSPAIGDQLAVEVRALVEGQNLISEPAETRSADLACLDVNLTPNELPLGQSATVSFLIRNNGPDNLEPGMYLVVLFIDNEQVYVALGSEPIAADQEITLDIPAEQWQCRILSEGEHAVRAAVIGYEYLQDRSNNNNNVRKNITVVAPQP